MSVLRKLTIEFCGFSFLSSKCEALNLCSCESLQEFQFCGYDSFLPVILPENGFVNMSQKYGLYEEE